MLKRVQKLFDIIKKAEEELKEIRKKCPHTKYSIGKWMFSPGNIQDCKICDRCNDCVGAADCFVYGNHNVVSS